MTIIDTDVHLTEPPDLWTSRMPSKWGDLIPHVRWDDGRQSECWFVGDKLISGLTIGVVNNGEHGEPVIREDEFPNMPKRWADVHPSQYDPHARAKVMDSVGITMAALYPNLGFVGPDIYHVAKEQTLDFQTEAGGSPQQIARTVLAAESANVAAFHIEDLETSSGKHLIEEDGFDFGNETLVPKAKAVANIRAAVAARRNPDTVIVGRTDAAAVTGVQDAIDRANAYAEAGADMIKFAHLELADLERVAKETSAPILYYNVKTPPEDREIAERAGVKIRFHPFATLVPAMDAVVAALTELRDTGSLLTLDTIPSYTQAQDYVGATEWAARARPGETS
jgi:2-methylisocitrate lyase-like PEP mutase family enzyme